MRTLTLAQIEEIKGLNEYSYKQILMHEKEAEEVRAFHSCTIQHWFDESRMYYKHSTMVLQIEPFEIGITYDSYRKKWRIFSHFTSIFKNITHYTLETVSKDIEEPKNIGKLSTKKINDWVNCLTEVYNRLSKVNESNSNEIEMFLKSIEGQDVRWFNNKRGQIVKNGIVFRFTIESTYVSTNTEIYYDVNSSLETFLQLSDNKYLKTKKHF